uniref:Uncharacterized protein n=1 Tax=Opuntia streptacantha TaxID=393608 RepID=A0A7C9ADU5_OPUST
MNLLQMRFNKTFSGNIKMITLHVQRCILKSVAENIWYISKYDIPHKKSINSQPNAAFCMDALPATTFSSIVLQSKLLYSTLFTVFTIKPTLHPYFAVQGSSLDMYLGDLSSHRRSITRCFPASWWSS